MNATAKKTAEPEVIGRKGPDGRPLRINPAWITWNTQGQVWTEYQVRLPDGASADDLNANPDLWVDVQGSRTSLKKFDRLLIVAYDETWMADAIVSEATGKTVTLAGYKIVQLPKRHGALPETEDFKVVWGGAGYYVERKSNGLKVSDMVPSLALATQFMNSKYSRVG